MAVKHASAPVRKERIDLRTTDEEKASLVHAATLERLDLTSFILRHALLAARRKVAAASRLQLTETERQRFLQALENPPEPTDKLRRAALRWRQQS